MCDSFSLPRPSSRIIHDHQPIVAVALLAIYDLDKPRSHGSDLFRPGNFLQPPNFTIRAASPWIQVDAANRRRTMAVPLTKELIHRSYLSVFRCSRKTSYSSYKPLLRLHFCMACRYQRDASHLPYFPVRIWT